MSFGMVIRALIVLSVLSSPLLVGVVAVAIFKIGDIPIWKVYVLGLLMDGIVIASGCLVVLLITVAVEVWKWVKTGGIV